MPTLSKATIDFPDSAPVRLAVEVELNSSPEAVWNLLIDNPGWVHWFNGVTLCEDTSPQTSGVGATRRIVVNGLQADEEIIAWEPMRRWGFTVVETSRTFARRWVERVTLEPIEQNGGNGTRVRYETGLELLWLAKLFKPILIRGIRNSWHSSLSGIDAYLATKSLER